MKNLFYRNTVRQVRRVGLVGLVRLLLAALALSPFGLRAEISEPDTLFYGKIINRTSRQQHQLTQGTLTWLVRRPDGRQISLSTRLLPLKNGSYSYRLGVPAEALVYGLTVSSNAVPLSQQPAACSHLSIQVDGVPAAIMAPGSSTFAVSQTLRASSYRLDLELFNGLSSTSGDGIPDWWKDKYGAIDPNADPDGDGWSNLQEFLHASSPTNDNRIPTLTTTEQFVYPDGATGIRLQAIDSDTLASNIVFSVSAVPQTGTLFLRNAAVNPANPDSPLSVGATFTQADVNNGRLLFVHNGGAISSAIADALSVVLHDETPSRSSTNSVALTLYQPAYSDATLQAAQAVAPAPACFSDVPGLSFYEQQMLLNYFLSRDGGYAIWDGCREAAPQQISVPSSGLSQAEYTQYVTSFGHDRRHLLVAGAGGDALRGGMENDILIAGQGADSLRGNGGSDLFVLSPSASLASRVCTIEDFRTADLDVLDVSRLLVGASPWVTNYIRVTNSGTNSYLNINYNGDNANFTNCVVTLLGTSVTQDGLRTLVENGSLYTGSKVVPARISIAATRSGASQNGPLSGEITVSRSGETNSSFTVNLQITGSAVNGNDYQYISPQLVFVPGQRTATLQVNPYATSSIFTQVVQVAVSSGTGYEMGSPTLAQVTIEPMLPQISIQTLEPIASKVDQTAGLFLVSRGGVVNNSVLVRLTIGGTAPASHYNTLSSFLNFQSQQTTALISVTPKPTATLSNGLESVQISVKPDPSYRIVGQSTDRVLLVDQNMTFALWQQKYFPGSNEDPSVFARQDTGNTGVLNIFRYAYGLNATSPLPQSRSRFPGIQLADDQLSLSFKQPPAISDLTYSVEVSDDLVNWRSSSADLEQYLPTTASTNDFETIFYRSTTPVSSTPKQFMRVRVFLQ